MWTDIVVLFPHASSINKYRLVPQNVSKIDNVSKTFPNNIAPLRSEVNGQWLLVFATMCAKHRYAFLNIKPTCCTYNQSQQHRAAHPLVCLISKISKIKPDVENGLEEIDKCFLLQEFKAICCESKHVSKDNGQHLPVLPEMISKFCC